MIYLDTSVALAHLLAEDRRPAAELWAEELVSSRILAYELWNRLHVRDLARTHGDPARALLARVSWIALEESVLERALHPFPAPVRTLDAFHLASALFLRDRGKEVVVATYDVRLASVATALGLRLLPLS